MASIKLYATLAAIAALYCTAMAFPLFPPSQPALPIDPTEATTETTPATFPTTETTSSPVAPSAPTRETPDTLGGFLEVHGQGNKEPLDSTPDSALNSTQTNRPKSLQNFLNIHSPDNSGWLAFHVQLDTNITLKKYAEIELQNFTQLKPGQFAMGKPSFNPFNGTFTAPVKGIYHFTAQVHLLKNHLKISGNPYVTASICIDGDCERNAALQSIAGITSERFSALVTGELQVEKDQVVSVFVKNNSDRRLLVDEATSFMGYFISESL